MSRNRLFSITMLLSIILSVTTTVFAANNNKEILNCPTANEVSKFNMEAQFPYGFDAQSNSYKIFSIGSDGRIEDYDDPNWALVLYPVKVKPSESTEQVIFDLLNNLQPVTAESTTFYLDNEKINVCAYTTQKDEGVSAVAYYLGDVDHEDDDQYFTKVQNRKAKLLNMTKNLITK